VGESPALVDTMARIALSAADELDVRGARGAE